MHLLNILIADDDPDDRELAEEALAMTPYGSTLSFVRDGRDLIDYLEGTGDYASQSVRLPDLILLDLNMPRMDGRAALKHIRESEKLKHIPIVILTTSKDDRDVTNAYMNGANSFITKPSDFDEFVTTLNKAAEYWSKTVRLPSTPN